MLEVRRCRFAMLACLTLVTAACGVSLPGGGGDSLEESTSHVIGCPSGAEESTCAGREGDSASSPEECRAQYQRCLDVTGDEPACRRRLEWCLANPPPPPPPPPPSSEDQCFLSFRACYGATGELDACYARLKFCLANLPPPPPPTPEEQCRLDYRSCLERTGGDERLCRARYEQCLASIPPAP
jgi:hypothetical protein